MKTNNYKTPPQSGLFTYLERLLELRGIFLNGLPIRLILPLLYAFFLGIIYVGNTHYHEKTLRKITHLQPIVDNLRLQFTTLKSSYMVASKQSEVARKVAPLGIYESKSPPFKIQIKEDETI